MDKIQLIKALNELILATGDEDIFEVWFMTGVPDSPSEEDFEFIANNETSFKETVNTFIRLSKHFKEGLNLYGNWYKGEILCGS